MKNIFLLSLVALLLAAHPALANVSDDPLRDNARNQVEDSLTNLMDVDVENEAVLEIADKIARNGSGGGQGRGRGRGRGSSSGSGVIIIDDHRGRGRGSDDGISHQRRGRGSDDGLLDDSRGRGRGSDDGSLEIRRGRDLDDNDSIFDDRRN